MYTMPAAERRERVTSGQTLCMTVSLGRVSACATHTSVFGSRLVHSVHGRRSVRPHAPPRAPPPSCRGAAAGEQRGDASGVGRTASTHGCGATRPGSSSTTPFIIVRRARLDGGAGSVPEPTWSLGLAWPARRRRCADSNPKGCPTQPAVARKWGWAPTRWLPRELCGRSGRRGLSGASRARPELRTAALARLCA